MTYVPSVQFSPDFNHNLIRQPGVAVPLDELGEPTDAKPGSDEKIEVMSMRFDLGQPLFHPDDQRGVVVKIGVAGEDARGQREKIEVEHDDEQEDLYEYE